MRKLIVLLRKDITLDMTNLLIVILLSIGIPIYINYLLRDAGMQKGADFISLFLSTVYCFFMVLSKLGLIEHKYNGNAYLTLTPINRRDIVLSKYVLFLLIYIICLAGYGVSYILIPFIQPLSLIAIITTWTVNILFLGLYIPLEFKLGYDNVKYFFTAIIVISPLLIGLLGKYLGVSFFQMIVEEAENILYFMLVLSFILIVISYNVSVRIFNAKDL